MWSRCKRDGGARAGNLGDAGENRVRVGRIAVDKAVYSGDSQRSVQLGIALLGRVNQRAARAHPRGRSICFLGSELTCGGEHEQEAVRGGQRERPCHLESRMIHGLGEQDRRGGTVRGVAGRAVLRRPVRRLEEIDKPGDGERQGGGEHPAACSSHAASSFGCRKGAATWTARS